MSEELVACRQLAVEPPLVGQLASGTAGCGAAKELKRAAPTPISPDAPKQPRTVTEPSSSSRNIPGGGSALATGDKPGDPFATLIVIAGDCLLGKQPYSRLTEIPPLLEKALCTALSFLDPASRCVVICAGGQHLTQALMEQVVSRTPRGLDSFGPGRLVEACFKERSAAYGNLWESTLLVKVEPPPPVQCPHLPATPPASYSNSHPCIADARETTGRPRPLWNGACAAAFSSTG